MSICFQMSVFQKMHHLFDNQQKLSRSVQIIKTFWNESSMGICLFIWQIHLTAWIVGGVQNSLKIFADVG